MTSFVYDNTDLWDDKSNDSSRRKGNRSTQWWAEDAALAKAALQDLRAAVLNQGFNAKAYGVVGDGSTDDAPKLQAALNTIATVTSGTYGGFLYLPRGVYLLGSQITMPNGVGLVGAGPTATILRARSGFSATSLIRNLNQDGTQEFAFLESLQIDGNQGGGAVCSTAVVDFTSLFINSYIRDVLVLGGSNVGAHIGASGSPGGAGPLLLENLWCVNNVGHNLFCEEMAGNVGAFLGVVGINVTCEHQGSGKSAIYLKGIGGAAQWCFYNTHIEQGTTATARTAITIDGVSNCRFDGVQLLCNPATMSEGVLIANVAQNVNIEIGPIYNPNLCNPIVRDLKASRTIGAVNVWRYVTSDVAYRGGPKVQPTSASDISLTVQDSGGTDRVWFDGNGRLKGNGVFQASLEILSNPIGTVGASDERGWTVTMRDASNPFGVYYPNAGGGVVRERMYTGAADVRQIGTDGSEFHYQVQTFQSNVTLQSNLTVQRAVLYSNELAPAALGADQNDYSPTNLANAYDLLLSSSIANTNITGIATGAAGRELFVYNSGGSNTITLKHQSASSTAANRIIGRGNADVVLSAGQGVLLRYSSSLSRWVVRHAA